MIKSLWKKVWHFLKKMYVHLPYDPTIPLLGVYSRILKDIEVHVHKKA